MIATIQRRRLHPRARRSKRSAPALHRVHVSLVPIRIHALSLLVAPLLLLLLLPPPSFAPFVTATVVISHPYTGKPPHNLDAGEVSYESQPAAFGGLHGWGGYTEAEGRALANLFLPPTYDRYVTTGLCTKRHRDRAARRLRGSEELADSRDMNTSKTVAHPGEGEDEDEGARTSDSRALDDHADNVPGRTNYLEKPEPLGLADLVQDTQNRRRDPLPIALLVQRGGCSFAQKARNAVYLNKELRGKALELLESSEPDVANLLEIRYLLVADVEPTPGSDETGDELVLMKKGDDEDDIEEIQLAFLSYDTGVDLLGRMKGWDDRKRAYRREEHGGDGGDVEDGTTTLLEAAAEQQESARTYRLGAADMISTHASTDDSAWYFPISIIAASPYGLTHPHGGPDNKGGWTTNWGEGQHPSPFDVSSAMLRYVIPTVGLLIVMSVLIAGLLFFHRYNRGLRSGEAAAAAGENQQIGHQGDGARKLTREEVMLLPEFEYRGDCTEEEDRGSGADAADAGRDKNEEGRDCKGDVEEEEPFESEQGKGTLRSRKAPPPSKWSERAKTADASVAPPGGKTTPLTESAEASIPIDHQSEPTAALDAETGNSSDETPATALDPLDPTAANMTTFSTTCSICINDFTHGEKLRLLPQCGHAFHDDCVSPWLTERSACCPSCKREVVLVREDDGKEKEDGEEEEDGNN